MGTQWLSTRRSITVSFDFPSILKMALAHRKNFFTLSLTEQSNVFALLSVTPRYPVFKSNCYQQKMYCVKTIHISKFGFFLSESIFTAVFSCKISALSFNWFSLYIIFKCNIIWGISVFPFRHEWRCPIFKRFELECWDWSQIEVFLKEIISGLRKKAYFVVFITFLCSFSLFFMFHQHSM